MLVPLCCYGMHATRLHAPCNPAHCCTCSNRCALPVQEQIERQLHDAMAAIIQKRVAEARHQDWAPEAAYSSATSTYLENLFIDLQACTSTAPHMPSTVI